MLMGQREYARHRGCALRAVQKAIEAKRISLVTIDGKMKIDSDQADRDWLNKTDAAKRSLLHSQGPAAPQDRLPGDTPLPPEDLDGGDESDEDETAFRRSRAEQMQIRVERERIELDILRDKYIDAEEARRLAFTAFRALRDELLNVPARIKDQCAAEADAFRVEQIMDAELSAALERFNPVSATRESDEDDETS